MRSFLIMLGILMMICMQVYAQNGYWDTTRAEMPTTKWSAASEVVDGKIYIIGGFIQPVDEEGWSSYGISKVEVYDPVTDTWDTMKTPMPTPRGHMASAVVNDKIYIIGGSAGGSDQENFWKGLNCITAYDPYTDSWDTTLTPMPTARFECQAAVIDSQIFVFGGLTDYPDLKAVNDLEVYDTVTDTWDTTKTQMPTAKAYPATSVIGSSIYITGGYPGVTLVHYASVERYDTENDTWDISIADLPEPRAVHSAGVLHGFIYLFGGSHRVRNNGLFEMRASVAMYDPLMDIWLNISTMPTARETLNSELVDEIFYTIGGGYRDYAISTDYWKNVNIIEAYTPVQYPIYAYNYNFDSKFCDFETDSLQISSEFINHFDHGFSAKCYFKSFDSTYRDSVDLYDDGMHGDNHNNDGIFGNFIKDIMIEEKFTLDLVTTNAVNGEKFTLPNLFQFTSIGPIVYDHYELVADTFPHQGDYLRFKITLKNKGAVTAAENISAVLTALDTCAHVMVNFDPTYGNMEPGTYATTTGSYRIRFYNVSPETVYVPFKLDIASNDILFWSDSFATEVAPTPTGIISDTDVLPREFSIGQNYPNPFNPSTTIEFDLPKSSDVRIEVYNIAGQKIQTLLDKKMPARSHQIEFNAENLSSGVYFYRIEAGEFQDVKKMILIK